MDKPTSTIPLLSGYGNYFETEAVVGAIPKGQNNPQKCPFGLYAEQLSGSAFTMPREKNLRTWLYRILPSVKHGKVVAAPEEAPFLTEGTKLTPERLRWKPLDYSMLVRSTDFIQGLFTVGTQGEPTSRDGVAIHLYIANCSMENKCFFNSDGDWLIVPQEGGLRIQTELGLLPLRPGHIAVIPRGVKFRVELLDGKARGYICEVYTGHFELPDLGLIGSNGLAAPRDFLYPVAYYEEKEVPFAVIQKYGGKLFRFSLDHSPFDVVGWHGNYAPFIYDLSLFCPVNSVLYDHMDPSIFTVLTCKSSVPGLAVVDFVIFPPRWMTQEHTFRPPYFHRNCMTEYMGLIRGIYDAKAEGFVPGSASLHSMMSAHGPDAVTFEMASNVELSPSRVGEESLAFMFETSRMLKLTDWALDPKHLDVNYIDCWQPLKKLASLQVE
ncbi:homogentisate 1,2-dioxygenase [Galdieria sulphuraria]|uniref:homogentisate 1,2-dioxygenase n=1 Tax=Galdieria sulphuraria TaxID=130081 RepID=M2Y0Y3_GALSU|nr:homogentisate 1,2-dioxygenase [Galdieria sulphuraria]EME29474.1 homogentisate 1,2-dioxygenase [Galdieria sulphuraria]|eukprot:XP_005705994.1 homogentisate 1,2-dioxygenase [Galdieria sulphuraria]